MAESGCFWEGHEPPDSGSRLINPPGGSSSPLSRDHLRTNHGAEDPGGRAGLAAAEAQKQLFWGKCLFVRCCNWR